MHVWVLRGYMSPHPPLSSIFLHTVPDVPLVVVEVSQLMQGLYGQLCATPPISAKVLDHTPVGCDQVGKF